MAWYRSSNAAAIQVGLIGFVICVILLSIRDGFHFHWVRYWWAWLIMALAGVLVGLTQLRGTGCSAGAEWVRGPKSWVHTYDLVKVRLSVGVGQLQLSMTDRGRRSLSMAVSELQADPLLWDLVYNGILHSVIAGNAETNGQLHRYLRVPYRSGGGG